MGWSLFKAWRGATRPQRNRTHRQRGNYLGRDLRVEPLECRQMLSCTELCISEIFFRAPQIPTSEQQRHEYLELRGEPNATIAAGTYLTVVNGSSNAVWDPNVGGFVPQNPGEIRGFVDLGGVALGSNGYLFIRADGQFYHPPTNPNAAVITGELPTFGNSTSMLLVQSPTALVDGSDVDADDDGTLDGSGAGWTVLDGVTLMDYDADETHRGYGKLYFLRPGYTAPIPAGVATMNIGDLSYIARVGESTGWTKDDWLTGLAQRNETNTAWEIEHGIGFFPGGYDSPSDIVFAGHSLDHIGAANFFSTVEGQVFADANLNGIQDVGEAGLANEKVFVDLNGNGVHDSFQVDVEPDDWAVGTELHDRYPGFTPTHGNINNEVTTDWDIDVVRDTFGASTGEKVFALLGSNQFSPGGRLLMNFHYPVSQVSIDVFGIVPGAGAVGRLEVYDAQDNLLDLYESGPVFPSIVENIFESMIVTRGQADIAYAVAYAIDTGTVNSGGLDNLQFTVMEPFATTDADGKYFIRLISPHSVGSFPLRQATNAQQTIGGHTLGFNGPTGYHDKNFGNTAAAPVVGDALAGRTPGGDWWVAREAGGNFSTEKWGQWSAAVAWQDVLTADVDGDGLQDMLGRADNGQWWVARNSGGNFVTEHWGAWSNGVAWQDVSVMDVDDDGDDDVVGRANGQWWVARSTGAHFVNEYWGSWSNAVVWEDVLSGDFDGDGRGDIAGRANGDWWLAKSTGSQFLVERWGSWSNAVVWNDVRVGDFDGDGRDDLAGRANGQWWLAHSTGTNFVSQYWGKWSAAAAWQDVLVGDFDDDGNDDIAGRVNGQWWLARSNGAAFVTEFWGRWSSLAAWQDVLVGDFDGDGDDDIAGRASGEWWLAESSGANFTAAFWGRWTDALTWQDVQMGRFS